MVLQTRWVLTNWSVRTGLKAQLSDSVSVLLRYTHSDKDDPTTQLVNGFVDRGVAALTLDGPGQGETSFKLPVTH